MRHLWTGALAALALACAAAAHAAASDTQVQVTDGTLADTVAASSADGQSAASLSAAQINSGTGDNAASVLATALDDINSGTGPGLATTSASASQSITGASPAPGSRSDALADAMSGNVGSALANQAPGDGDNQLNALAVAFSGRTGGGMAMAEADLTQLNTRAGDGLTLTGTPMAGAMITASITRSLNGNAGFAAFNQSSGSGNNQANVISLASVGLRPAGL